MKKAVATMKTDEPDDDTDNDSDCGEKAVRGCFEDCVSNCWMCNCLFQIAKGKVNKQNLKSCESFLGPPPEGLWGSVVLEIYWASDDSLCKSATLRSAFRIPCPEWPRWFGSICLVAHGVRVGLASSGVDLFFPSVHHEASLGRRSLATLQVTLDTTSM